MAADKSEEEVKRAEAAADAAMADLMRDESGMPECGKPANLPSSSSNTVREEDTDRQHAGKGGKKKKKKKKKEKT